ncbi:IS1 family transposase, partial [Shigella sonnei]|uniref:IS1 family transposase n=1 Tax=Shigella sonnei TaxID=624 RepID=UPI0020927E17
RERAGRYQRKIVGVVKGWKETVYTQRIERHNLNLRQHLARLGRKSLSFSKSVELHDKVIGHYLNIKHYQ